MTEDATPDVVPADTAIDDEPEGHPKGALLLGGLFIVLMAAVWLYAYLTMIAWS